MKCYIKSLLFLILVTVFLTPAFASWGGSVDAAFERTISTRYQTFCATNRAEIQAELTVCPAVHFLGHLVGQLERSPAERPTIIRMIRAVTFDGTGVGGIDDTRHATAKERRGMLVGIIAVESVQPTPDPLVVRGTPHQRAVLTLAQQSRSLLVDVAASSPPPSYVGFFMGGQADPLVRLQKQYDPRLIQTLGSSEFLVRRVWGEGAPNLLKLLTADHLRFLARVTVQLRGFEEEDLKNFLRSIMGLSPAVFQFLGDRPYFLVDINRDQLLRLLQVISSFSPDQLVLIKKCAGLITPKAPDERLATLESLAKETDVTSLRAELRRLGLLGVGFGRCGGRGDSSDSDGGDADGSRRVAAASLRRASLAGGGGGGAAVSSGSMWRRCPAAGGDGTTAGVPLGDPNGSKDDSSAWEW
jgi:hypothetical protein